MWLKLRGLIVAALLIGGLWWVSSVIRSGSQDQGPADPPTPGTVVASANTPAPDDTPTADVAPLPSDTPTASSSLAPSNTPASTDTPAPAVERDLRIVTLLPKDAIPAVFDPEFLTVEEADEWYDDQELVLGVEINGEARAYSIPFLSGREIVNDTVGGRKIAVTW
jgi:hypothetical protein